MAQNKTAALAKMENSNNDTDGRNGSGSLDLLSVHSDEDGSLGSRSISEIIGVSGPNGADGTRKLTNALPGSNEAKLMQNRSGGSSLQAAITVKVEKAEVLKGATSERKTENISGLANHAVRGKKGIDSTGTWQDEQGSFYIEELTERQKRIIDARRDAGDEVYIDEQGNIRAGTQQFRL